MPKAIIYVFVFLFVIWSMEGLNLNKLFKQNRVMQARLMYIFIGASLSYLVTNFIYDFVISFK